MDKIAIVKVEYSSSREIVKKQTADAVNTSLIDQVEIGGQNPVESKPAEIAIPINNDQERSPAKAGTSKTDEQNPLGREQGGGDIIPDHDSYKNIHIDDAAKMMGHFTQKMKHQGFPWAFYAPTDSSLKERKRIGDYEALLRLNRDEQVIFQPRRVLGLGISPPQFKGKDITGKEAAGKMDVKTGGVERNFGKGICINNLSELKLLYELYDPSAAIDQAKADDKTIAAKNLSYFTSKSLMGQYPWKLYKPNRGTLKTIMGGVKTALKASITGTFIGTLASLAVGGVISIAAGAALGAGLGVSKALYNYRLGEEIDPLEALSRLTKGKEVTFQEKKKHEIGLAIPFPVSMQLGSLAFYVNHRTPSKINNLEELALFNTMQDQLPDKKK